MEDYIPDIIKKSYKKRLVIAKFMVKGCDVIRRGRNTQNDGARISRSQRQDSKNKKRYSQQYKNHIYQTF